MKRLAIITSGYLPVIDGVTISTRERLRQLSALGIETLLIAPDYEATADYYGDWQDHVGDILPGVHVAAVPSGPFAGIEWERNPVRAARAPIEALLDDFQPDAIHVDEPERLWSGLLCRAGARHARRHNIPLVAFYHTNFVDYAPDYIPGLPSMLIKLVQRIGSRIIAAVYNGYDATLVTSASSREKLTRMGVRNLRFDHFHGVDTQRFNPVLRKPGYFANNWNLPELDDRIVLLFVGRIAPDKGWIPLMQQIPRIAEVVGDRVAFLVAGDGDLYDDVANTLIGKVPHFHLLGRVHPDKIPGLMANATIHVTASEKENFGLTVLEAFASGTPVVGPRAAGIGDLVEHDVTGCLYSPEQADELTTTIINLVNDTERLERLSAGALSRGKALDWKQTIRVWLDAITTP